MTLGGEVGTNDWARPYLDEQFGQYTSELLARADALLLGRVTYEGLSAAYTTLRELGWNAEVIEGDVASRVEELKGERDLLKYGNGPLDVTLVEHGLIDEFHLFLTPVAIGRGRHMFEDIDTAPQLRLLDVTRFDSGVLALVYAPK